MKINYIPSATILSLALISVTSLIPCYSAEDLTCGQEYIHVMYEDAADAAITCNAADVAISFMKAHGFETALPISIRVVREINGKRKILEYGHFDPVISEIKILSIESCKQAMTLNPPFGIPISSDLHRSFIIHEVAHAIAQHNFTMENPSVEAQEYIAYTVQLATMDRLTRKQIMDRYKIQGFEDESEITALYLAMDPASFGVKSYRHFLLQENGNDFFQRLLKGNFQPPTFE